MARMHVTYLNGAYDQDVLSKWAATGLSAYGFDGISGLDYIERRLGYRLRVVNSGRFSDGSIYFEFCNDGFGTLLFPCGAKLIFSSGIELRVLDLSGLCGARSCVFVFDSVPDDYELVLFDSRTGQSILFV